jgi:hypothetical protein
LESVCFKSQQEETRNTPAGEMWGRALRLSAPTPQVYDITHTSAQGSPAQPAAASARGAKYWSPCSLKFTPAAAHAEPSGGRSQEKLLLIQLACPALARPIRIAGRNTPANTNAKNPAVLLGLEEPLSKRQAVSQLSNKGAENNKRKNTGA